MKSLKMRLFAETHRYANRYRHMEENTQYTDMETIAVKSSFQTMYRFLITAGLEDEYLAWLESLSED